MLGQLNLKVLVSQLPLGKSYPAVRRLNDSRSILESFTVLLNNYLRLFDYCMKNVPKRTWYAFPAICDFIPWPVTLKPGFQSVLLLAIHDSHLTDMYIHNNHMFLDIMCTAFHLDEMRISFQPTFQNRKMLTLYCVMQLLLPAYQQSYMTQHQTGQEFPDASQVNLHLL
jgi:hypothetical protein